MVFRGPVVDVEVRRHSCWRGAVKIPLRGRGLTREVRDWSGMKENTFIKSLSLVGSQASFSPKLGINPKPCKGSSQL